MSIRTSKETVTFTRPFVLAGFEETLPAGDYVVETDKELLEGLSFPAYRRVLTLLHLHTKPGRPGMSETLPIDPNVLEAALKRDGAARKTEADAERTASPPPDRDPRHTNHAVPTRDGTCSEAKEPR